MVTALHCVDRPRLGGTLVRCTLIIEALGVDVLSSAKGAPEGHGRRTDLETQAEGMIEMERSVHSGDQRRGPMKTPPSSAHYPYLTRRTIDLHRRGLLTLVTALDVEPEYGYVTRVNYDNGRSRIMYGNDLGINVGAACDLAKDKGHTKFMLRSMGVSTPRGAEFLLPTWAKRVRESSRLASKTNIQEMHDIAPFVESNFGYPAYVKPIDGSKGAGVFKVFGRSELHEALDTLEENKVRLALVEEPITMPDYRVITLDGDLISAYRRVPLSVTGDGTSTITQLLSTLQDKFVAEGRDTRISIRDPRIGAHLDVMNRTLSDVPAKSQHVTLLPLSNLSTGGIAEDVSNVINPRWVELAAHVAQSFNLRLCGLDLACDDITAMDAPYSVLEVNATPGLDHYALSGAEQRELVDGLYVKVLNVYP
jgi:D-alanine-D-alanine ligase-like ATP-grasp enzyme